jgi:predicted membrane protein
MPARVCADRYDAALMLDRVRAMPAGIRLFLVYALLILAGIGLSLRFVVDQAIAAPISPVGVIVMVLLAYTIFTITLVLQRKQAARNLAIGLASLTIPLVPLLLLSGLPVEAIFVAALGLLLLRGLLRPEVRTYLNEP